jgi:hypothetical protein
MELYREGGHVAITEKRGMMKILGRKLKEMSTRKI